jgi:hypothetical protein
MAQRTPKGILYSLNMYISRAIHARTASINIGDISANTDKGTVYALGGRIKARFCILLLQNYRFPLDMPARVSDTYIIIEVEL